MNPKDDFAFVPPKPLSNQKTEGSKKIKNRFGVRRFLRKEKAVLTPSEKHTHTQHSAEHVSNATKKKDRT